MFHLKAFALGGVAAISLISAASAADLLPPPPDAPPPPVFIGGDSGGWYIRGDAGVGLNNSPSFEVDPSALSAGKKSGYLSSTATEGFFNPAMSDAALLDFGVGYQINQWFRADVTGELRGGASYQGLDVLNDNANKNSLKNKYFADLYKTDVTSYLAMFNAYVDLGTWYGVTPFIGAGIGAAFNNAHGGTDVGTAQVGTKAVSQSTGGFLSSATTTSLAWSLKAGFDFAVTRNLKLELGYSFTDFGKIKTGGANCYAGAGNSGAFSSAACSGGGYYLKSKELTSNDFKIGLRYYFDAEAPPPPAEPLIRKY